jgi:aspartyl-tRNA(Asn)/glutamyl-tRNA(Gln) amidotransferase subunit B
MAQPVSALETYPGYEAIIGIEVHVQLNTKSKIFCSSPHHVSKEPNTDICTICAGYPGSLPVLNRGVVDNAIRAGLATNCTIAQESLFDRKHYFYPDLPKNYQITQQFKPICTSGYIPIRLSDGSTKKINLTRIHMEEDAGKNIHSDISKESFVDLNRAGTPLLEMVSEPEISNAEEAKTYLKTLRSIVQYLGICTGNMEEGAFRADTNISVRKKGVTTFGTRVELKNINSFKFISDAIEYELKRQIERLEVGKTIQQETRLWDSKIGATFAMRTKEEAADYRYFNDPDLPIVRVDSEWIEQIRKQLPELPYEKFERLTTKLGLSAYEADILVEDLDLANYFDQAHAISKSKQVINWILRDLLGYVKENNITLKECAVTPQKLAAIIDMIESNKINNHAAKEVFALVAQTGGEPAAIVKEKGLKQIGSIDELDAIIKKIVDENPDTVAAYKQGKDRLFGFFVGQAMKKTEGKGDPKVIQTLLKKYLA